jgi:D-glycero-D-manno-heptose 1,7-bisphosphate phosphatase
VGVDTVIPRRAVFLDRDGVLIRAVIRNNRPFPPASLEQLDLLPGAAEAAAWLKGQGFLLLVVTNQPDVARGTLSRRAVESYHAALVEALALDGVFVCYHDDGAGCDCRKPKPGLILDAANYHNIRLDASFLIGDRWRDLDAAGRAGVHAVLIDHGYDERSSSIPPAAVVATVLQAARWITAGALGSLSRDRDSSRRSEGEAHVC